MMSPLILAVPLLLASPTADPPSTADRWMPDLAHTSVEFEARHFFTKVRGAFRDFEVDFVYDEVNPENSTVAANIRVTSVTTGNERRDAHLRTSDWFDVERFPEIRFRSERVEAVSADELRVHGVLTIQDFSRRVVLPVRRAGVQDIPAPMQQMMGGADRIAGFETTLTINRTDFGIGSGNWATTAVVGGPIEIHISMEAHRK